jgi:hypothetical protein
MNKLTKALISAGLTALLFFALGLQVQYPPTMAQVYAAAVGGFIIFLTRCKPLFDDDPAPSKNPGPAKADDGPKFPPLGVFL